MASQGGLSLGKRKEREPDDEPAEPSANNRLLAGYLAHEFLTRGTLFGRRFESNPGSGPAEGPLRATPPVYADVACLLKAADGAHVPGVINPTQLGRWLRISE